MQDKTVYEDKVVPEHDFSSCLDAEVENDERWRLVFGQPVCGGIGFRWIKCHTLGAGVQWVAA